MMALLWLLLSKLMRFKATPNFLRCGSAGSSLQRASALNTFSSNSTRKRHPPRTSRECSRLSRRADDVTYFAQIRGGGLDLVKWKLPHSHDQTMNEATTDERRYTGSAGSAAR